MNMSGINARIDTTNSVVPTTNSVVPTTNNQTSSALNNGDNGNGGAPCGACKFLRRKCLKGCVFAPYFLSEQGTEGFCAVHKVFGASNVSKLLLRIPLPEQRRQAVITIKYEAQARLLDPIYGCVRTIFALERQVEHLQAEIEFVRAQLSNSRLSVTTAALLYQQQQQQMQAINYNNNATTSWQTAANPAAASCCNNYNMQYDDDDANKADWRSPSKYVSASRHIYSSVKDEVEQIDAGAAAAANYNDDHHLASSSSNIGLEAVLAHSDHMCILDSLQRTIFSLDQQQHTNEAEFQAFAQYALSQGNLSSRAQ